MRKVTMMKHVICLGLMCFICGVKFAEACNVGDADCNGFVNAMDYRAVRDHFGQMYPTPGESIITINLPNLPIGARPLRLVRILAGSFQMGSDDAPDWSLPREQPVHTVSIGSDFCMGETEITQAQWTAVMGSNPSHFSSYGHDCPVENVSWDMCQQFITALNGLGQGTFRLPSEAEWEYAARAGTSTRFSFGDSACYPTGCTSCELDQYAWWCGNAGGTPHPVAGKLPNPFGLYDMHGNVWEWCEDDWHDSYVGAPTAGRAWIDSPRGVYRVLRGGSCHYDARYGRSVIRTSYSPSAHNRSCGVRVVHSAP